jgi:hypothetical protein
VTNDTDAEFFDIANEMVSGEANAVLDRHLRRTAKWLDMRRADGRGAELRDLIQKILGEPGRRDQIMTVYATALWRLLEEEGNDD